MCYLLPLLRYFTFLIDLSQFWGPCFFPPIKLYLRHNLDKLHTQIGYLILSKNILCFCFRDILVFKFQFVKELAIRVEKYALFTSEDWTPSTMKRPESGCDAHEACSEVRRPYAVWNRPQPLVNRKHPFNERNYIQFLHDYWIITINFNEFFI